MDTLEPYRATLERLLKERAAIPIANGEMRSYPVIDREGGHYLLMAEGWDGYKRVHGTLVNVDEIDGKFWVQRDGTEEGIAVELTEAGVPKERIVLGFQPKERRTWSGFAAG